MEGLWRCNQGRPKIRGVSFVSEMRKKRQSSSWAPMATGAIKYRVILAAGLI
jgi:hypothetical protein